jgi:hypothetical protein
MSGIEKIKAKIKKLMALSASSNPNESAAAAEAAQRLMADYKIDPGEINSLDISEEAAPTARREDPLLYEDILIRNIAGAFGCESLYSVRSGGCAWKFIGLSHRAQVAAFLGQVLLRKLRKSRAEYIKTLYRVRSRYRKTQRADDFCLSWVLAVTEKLSAFSGCSPSEKKEIGLFIAKNHPELTKVAPVRRSFGNANDALNGSLAGSGVELRHGVAMGPGSALLPGGAA